MTKYLRLVLVTMVTRLADIFNEVTRAVTNMHNVPTGYNDTVKRYLDVPIHLVVFSIPVQVNIGCLIRNI